ncbi:hypothetical protein REPUB_Repub12eG0118600 [Reevesia pubescens]
MASSKRTMLAFLFMLRLLGVTLGAVYKVGDSAGWTIMGNIDYSQWASTKSFHVGDSILFEYNNQFHSVMQVNLKDFQSCDVTSAIASYNSGSDSITLDRPGHYYFLCGVPGHCQAGQKVDVLVNPPSLGPVTNPSPLSYGSSPANAHSQMSAAGPTQSTAPSLHLSKLSLASGLVAFGLLGFAF